MKFLIPIMLGLIAVPAFAAEDVKPSDIDPNTNVKIYVDNRKVCGYGGRIAHMKEDAAKRKARAFARKLREQGNKNVEVIVLSPEQQYVGGIGSHASSVPVFVPIC